jgi:hypothetical protein
VGVAVGAVVEAEAGAGIATSAWRSGKMSAQKRLRERQKAEALSRSSLRSSYA